MICFIATCILGIAAFLAAAHQQPTQLTFFAIGDWGRQGAYNQTEVASLMARVASRRHPSFIISTGDNVYPNGLNASSDPLFTHSFTDVYHQSSLQVPWHAVLGNHDYGDGFEYCENDATTPCARGPSYQLGTALSKRDWRWHCERSYSLRYLNGLVEFFFIDTSPFIAGLLNQSWAQYSGGLLQQDWEVQLKEFEQRLARSPAQWKVVVGHHPPRSNGHHGNNTELIVHVEPLLVKYNVRAYIAGHDHSLEHISPVDLASGGMGGEVPQYFVSGGGSQCDREFVGTVDSQYQYSWSGFMSGTVTEDSFDIEFYTLKGGSGSGDDVEAAYTFRMLSGVGGGGRGVSTATTHDG